MLVRKGFEKNLMPFLVKVYIYRLGKKVMWCNHQVICKFNVILNNVTIHILTIIFTHKKFHELLVAPFDILQNELT